MSMPGADMRPDDGAQEYDGHDADDCPECSGSGYVTWPWWWEPEDCTCVCHDAPGGTDDTLN